MRIRPIHALLLAALVYWTTGAALYLHERIEHADGDEVVQVAGAAADVSHDGGLPKKHHDHDDCPTCQLLAHMQADHVAPPLFISLHLPSFFTLHLTDREAPTVDATPFVPIRGPPSAVEFSI